LGGGVVPPSVREHSYDEATGKCAHCGDLRSANVGEHAERSCVAREVPRATPSSMFGGTMDDIRARYLELKAEQDALRAKPDAG